MFEIKYDFTGPEDDELIEPDEMSLRHRPFPGNFLLRKDESSISIEHQSMPIVDSVFSLLRICNVLVKEKDGREEFQFPQSNKRITFKRDNDNVKILPSFSLVTLEIPVEDFRGGVKQFYRDVLLRVMLKNHSLKMNALLFSYLAVAENL